MKRYALLLAMLASTSAMADMSTAQQTASTAVQNYQSLPPAAQDAMKAQAKSEAQQYQQNWQQMTPEQQAAQKEQMKSEAQSKATAAGFSRPNMTGGGMTMQGGMGGGMHRRR